MGICLHLSPSFVQFSHFPFENGWRKVRVLYAQKNSHRNERGDKNGGQIFWRPGRFDVVFD